MSSSTTKKSNDAENGYSLKDYFLLTIPMLSVLFVVSCVIRQDYIQNLNSFMSKSRFYSSLPYLEYDLYSSVECSNDYDSTSCIPNKCGRYTTDYLVTADEAKILLNIAKRAFKYGTSDGASLFELRSGILTKGDQKLDVKKLADASKQPIYTKEEIDVYNTIRERVLNTMKIVYKTGDLYPTEPAYFSEITSNKQNNYNSGYLKDRADKLRNKNFDYTAIVYLTSHNVDFTGGSIVFNDTATVVSIEPRQARTVLFTSGSENTHRIDRVKSGVRYELQIPFTCNKYLAR